jgi:GR25 family glycosyltransferase involved in LPS biosynthesis
MNPFTYFDKIYCINLLKDTQRKEDMILLFEELGITDLVEFVVGIENEHSIIGCNKSSVNIFKDAKANNYNKIIIFEDDIITDGDVITKLQNCISDIENDWDLFYLGGIPHRVEWFVNEEEVTTMTEYMQKKHYLKYSNNLVKLNGGRVTLRHAVAYKSTTFDDFINKFEHIEIYKNIIMDDIDKWTVNYYQQQSNIKTFLACPMLFHQKYVYSNNTKQYVDMGFFNRDLYNELLKMNP